MVTRQIVSPGGGADVKLARGEQYGVTGYHANCSDNLRAEMDLAIAISACPTASCNDGPPLAFEVG